MDLLNASARLWARLAELTKHLFQIVARSVGSALRAAFGNISFSWSRPDWMPALGARIRKQPRHFAGGAAGVFAVIGLSWGGWLWYQHLPHPPEPQRISFTAPAPAITDYAPADGVHKIVIHPLDVKFSASAAPIELVGKTVSKGIAMTPTLKGTWSWIDDRTLHFVPAQDWPVGAHVEVEFNVRQAFAPHVLMADDHFAFDMPGFLMTRGSGEFYQDPTNPTAKKTIMTLDFNYPVDPAELEKRIGLLLKGRDGKGTDPIKFTVIYDAAKIKAFVHSQPLALPRDQDAVKMTVARGVRTVRGGEPTGDPLEMETKVPGLYSLAVKSVIPTLVNNDKYEPGQVVVITASDAVRGNDLARQVQAWVLPKRNPKVRQSDDARPYAWGYNEVSEDVLRQSRPLKLDVTPTEKEFSEVQSFKYDADPFHTLRTLTSRNTRRQQKKQRRSYSKCQPLDLEALEARIAPTVTSSFNSAAHLLSITEAATDSVTVGISGNNVVINNANPQGGAVAFSAVQRCRSTAQEPTSSTWARSPRYQPLASRPPRGKTR